MKPGAPMAERGKRKVRNAMPKVWIYPLCSACRAPYVLRHGFNMGDGGKEVWIWQRDCKHKKAVPLTSTALERLETKPREGSDG